MSRADQNCSLYSNRTMKKHSELLFNALTMNKLPFRKNYQAGQNHKIVYE